MNPLKSWNLKKCLDLGVWSLEITFGPLGPKDISSHKSRILLPIFTTSFSQEPWDKSNKIMKSQKMSWPWAVGPKNYIWATWAQKIYPSISPEPWLQFLQTGPYFLKNHVMNPINSWNLKKYLDLEIRGLEITFGLVGPICQNLGVTTYTLVNYSNFKSKFLFLKYMIILELGKCQI